MFNDYNPQYYYHRYPKQYYLLFSDEYTKNCYVSSPKMSICRGQVSEAFSASPTQLLKTAQKFGGMFHELEDAKELKDISNFKLTCY